MVFWDGPDSHFRFQRNIAALLRVEMSLVLQTVFSELGGTVIVSPGEPTINFKDDINIGTGSKSWHFL